ncbi:hypothetical protein Arub01_12680 [Actinomadura rubrobrunea]|uniref:Ferric oxidoreductase domain-containing protein n=1 Tax=Actinomadura rubrobrunea TaxID=115335 RepID=A0A9W6PTY6_9ACTN|nr:hypothetical protein [Actinomadura rubrobrunea]GLW63024.1 hypothetical protein Arub01_12680 [Actinomadura rubrobrunea]
MKIRSSDEPVLPSWALWAIALASVLVLVGAATPPGAAAAGRVQAFLNYYVGVFTLLTLTAAVVTGLLATDRFILHIRHRVLIQGVHRAASLLSVTCVIAHFTVKVLGGLASPAQIVIPSFGPIGLGTLAMEMMIFLGVTGVLRVRFAFRGGAPWLWRSMHAVAYVAWPLALIHGLTAGRAAANWVNLSYILCAGAVFLGLVTRLFAAGKPREIRYVGQDLTDPSTVAQRTMAQAPGVADPMSVPQAGARGGETVR